MSTPREHRRRGELFTARFELFADVLATGLAAAVAALPLVTLPVALSTACGLLRRRQLWDEPCTAGRYAAALRGRLARPGEWAAGGVLVAFAAVLAADAALATAGLPGAKPFALGLAAVAGGAAVVGLRACALYPGGGRATGPGRAVPEAAATEPRTPEAAVAGPEAHGAAAPDADARPGWAAAVRAGGRSAIADLPGSGLVLLALCTAAVCAWSLPPALFLLPGPLALALTAVELRWERAG